MALLSANSKTDRKKQGAFHNTIGARRGVSSVIATIMLIAIAVVGGTLVFATSGDYQGNTQISDSKKFVSLKITGHDARDAQVLNLHDGTFTNNSINPGNFDGQSDNGVFTGERIAVYLKNNSVSEVFIKEIRVGGVEYVFTSAVTLEPYTSGFMNPGEFVIVTGGTSGLADLSESSTAKLDAGQEVTLLIKLKEKIPISRDIQFKITSESGMSFTGTIWSDYRASWVE